MNDLPQYVAVIEDAIQTRKTVIVARK